MRYSIVFAASLAARVSGHGLIRSIEGANGVSMPGLTGESLFFATFQIILRFMH